MKDIVEPSSYVVVVVTTPQMFNVGQKHFPAVSAFFFMNFLDIVFLSMKLTIYPMDNVIHSWTENTWTWNTCLIKGAFFYTYIHKIFNDFAERIVKIGDMKFNSRANHVPIRKLSSCWKNITVFITTFRRKCALTARSPNVGPIWICHVL